MFTTETVLLERAAVQPGMIVQSSHGYRILVTELADTAENRGPTRTVQITGHIHANPERELVRERYPANSRVLVEAPDGIRPDHLGGVKAALHRVLDEHGVYDSDELVEALHSVLAGSEA